MYYIIFPLSILAKKAEDTRKDAADAADAADTADAADAATSRPPETKTLLPTDMGLRLFLILCALLKLKQMQLCIFQILHVQRLNDPFISVIYFFDLVSVKLRKDAIRFAPSRRYKE